MFRNITQGLGTWLIRKIDTRYGTWNVRSLYRVGTLGLETSEIEKFRVEQVGVQELRWEGSMPPDIEISYEYIE